MRRDTEHYTYLDIDGGQEVKSCNYCGAHESAILILL